MPKLWDETIDAHRRAVRDATLEATAALVTEHGLRSVTMSQIAEATGIGRATLYKYFPDVETILHAWHARQVSAHLERLAELRDRHPDAGERIEAVLEGYALIHHGQGAPRDHLPHAQQHLSGFMRDLLAEGAAAGVVRDDVAPAELATFCIQALGAAGSLPSKAAVHRLVAVTLAGLRPS